MNERLLSHLTVQDMPNIDMKWVAEDCGLTTAILLLSRLHGIEIYVPRKLPTNERKRSCIKMPNDDLILVAKACGRSVAVALMDKFRGQRLRIPRLGPSAKKKIIAVYYDAAKNNQKWLCLELGISLASFYRYINSKITITIQDSAR
jgi:hypothetical protein